MGAVQISGTFKKDERPYNGLEQGQTRNRG